MAMKLKSGFEVVRYSDLDYEQMTVELQYQGEQVAQINMDKGIENLEVELFTEFLDPSFKPVFKLTDLLEAIGEARKCLEGYQI